MEFVDKNKELTPEQIINLALSKGRNCFYGLLSGGKDSMSVCHYVATNYPDLFKGVLFADTTIGLDETKRFVIEECKRLGWKLHIRKSKRGTFREWVLKNGFPQKGIHNIIMSYLKYDAMRDFAIKEKLDEKPCMISGVRSKESMRRMRTMKEPVNHDGNLWFVAPFLNKSTEEVYTYLSEHGLKKSPAYTNLHISGDCLCGSFAPKEEIMMLRAFYPEIYRKIKHLELDIQLQIEKLEIEIKIMEKNGAKTELREKWIKHGQRVKTSDKMTEYELKITQLLRLKSHSTWGNSAGALEVENQTTLDAMICGECAIY